VIDEGALIKVSINIFMLRSMPEAFIVDIAVSGDGRR
jgi:hypothetical protein